MQGLYTKWLVLICLCIPFQVLDGQSTVLQREIGEIIRYESNIDFAVVPGILVGVMDGDSTYVCSFGELLDPDSIYQLGSVTKPVVAWLAAQALDSLGWRRDSKVCDFLPDSLCRNNWRMLTIDQVLTHRSGLPRMGNNMGEAETRIEDPYVEYNLALLASDLGGMAPVPGQYSYSHLGYGVLNWLFDKVGGIAPFAEQRLMHPNGLDKTGWAFPDKWIAQGHGMDGRVQPPWHFDALLPAMGLMSSMSDLMDMIALISPQLVLDRPTLTSSLKKELKALDKAGEYKVIDGWFLVQSGVELIFYHTGRTGGHQVSIAFMPEKHKGVVVISNGALGSNDLSLLVLNMVNRAK